MSLEAFAVSADAVALCEMGDKPQCLSLLLAARYCRPWPVMAGFLVAALLNHGAASVLGSRLTQRVDPQWMRWLPCASHCRGSLDAGARQGW